jgi:hypothetical protein
LARNPMGARARGHTQPHHRALMLLTDLAAKELEILGSFHAPICPKPAITLSRKDWHSHANGAVL